MLIPSRHQQGPNREDLVVASVVSASLLGGSAMLTAYAPPDGQESRFSLSWRT